jgi:hypothetical protein
VEVFRSVHSAIFTGKFIETDCNLELIPLFGERNIPISGIIIGTGFGMNIR